MASRDHYDLRLEWDGALESFAVPKGPSFDPRDKRLAVQVEAHPLEYRHFEGTIPRGEYGGGTVMLWDEGFWEPDKNAAEGLESGVLKFTLFGKRLRGKWALIRLKRKAGEKQDNWLLRKEKDAYAKEGSDLSEYDVSNSTGRTMTQIQEGQEDRTVKNPFTDAAPMLLKLVDQVPDGEDWLYELKYDGYRILAYLEGGGATLKTRSGSDYTSRFRSVASSLSDWSCGRAMVLDGEMTVTDPEGKTDFQALQNYLKNPKAHTLTYIVFDLLALDGADLREHSLIDRKQRLEALMKDAPKNLHFSSHVQGNGKESFAAACRAHMEGIVGKRAGSVYSGTRNGDWIKLKCGKRQTFLIGGYTRSAKRTEGVSALLLGAYENGTLEFLGRVGTGLTASDMKELETKCAPLQKDASPFHSPPKPKPGEATVWLEPVLAAEISFAEWTKAHLFRHASYKGLVTNIDPKNVMMDGADDTLKEPEPPEAPKNQAAGQETSTLVGASK